jgi:hypothetical protein
MYTYTMYTIGNHLDARYLFHIYLYIEGVYLYCLRHEWSESVCFKRKIYAEEFLLHQQKACTVEVFYLQC